MDYVLSNLANKPHLRTNLVVQLFVDALLLEAHDPAAPDLDNRHARLPRLAHNVLGCIRVALYVDLLERHPLFLEVTLQILALS